MVAWSDAGPGLVDDTRAFFGAGVTEGVPGVGQVHCFSQRYGTSGGTSRTRIGATEYQCDLTLGAAGGDGMSPALREANEAMKAAKTADEYKQAERRWYAIRDAERAKAVREPLRIERTTAQDVSQRPLPKLHRLSAEGEPLRYGVVWDGGELTWRWLAWLRDLALFWIFGAACLYAARVGWRKAAA